MTISWLMIIVGCLLLLVVCIIGIALMMLMGGSDRDMVSSAREGWIHSRSEKDMTE